MTYNIRYDNAYDQGTRSWLYRRQSVVDLIKESDPDVLCLQEAMENQYDYIREKLKDDYIGVGLARDYDTVNERHIGEYAPVLFKTKVFDLIDRDTFWLSATPYVKGSKSWDSCCTRICTWAELKLKDYDNQYLIVYNTHWDHIGLQARIHSSSVIKNEMSKQLQKLQAKNDKLSPIVVMTGDLNCIPTTEELKRMFIPVVDKDVVIHMQNSKETAKDVVGPTETFTDFDFSLVIEIDYVLWQSGFKGESKSWSVDHYEVIPDVVSEDYDIDEGEEGQTTYVPSDHRPILTKFVSEVKV
jgi:endonuclease/exonuclease/phosphatase family metal-dependent hydrolase